MSDLLESEKAILHSPSKARGFNQRNPVGSGQQNKEEMLENSSIINITEGKEL